jgi:general secretion pathway protein D
LRGAPLEIAFPSQNLEVVGVDEGLFFKQDGSVASFTHAVNTTTGRVAVGILRSDTTGVSGQSSLIQLRLRAKAPGPVELEVTNLKAIGTDGPTPVGPLPKLRLSVQ